MKDFKNNYSKLYLLTNKPILFWNEENNQKFELILPTLETIYTNDNILFLINFLENDLNEIKKLINMEITSHYNFIHIICSLAKTNKEFKDLSNKILNGLKTVLPGLEFNLVLRIGNIIIDSKLFDEIVNILFAAMDKEIIQITENDDDFTRREKEAKLRAKRIRANAKNKQEGTSFEDILAAILYEFPQYKIEDLMKMNLYTIYYLFKYVGKIANYEVSKIAAGNGLAKKHKYFIEK